jgi:PKD repeat protein
MHQLAARLRAHVGSRSRGQSLVEFAMVLPILLLLTLTALDFGRVYLGYINLQNMARIAANYAANNPDAWAGTGNAEKQLAYQNQILGDAVASNCDLPVVAGTKTAPAPVFTDWDADGIPEIGDIARVNMTCRFGIITPVIQNIVGGSIAVSASSSFSVKSGMTTTQAGSGPGVAPVAAFTGNTATSPSSLTGTAPFTVVFRDTSGGNPTAWFWDFNDPSSATPTSTLQDPLGHTFTTTGTYLVSMTASNAWGSSTAFMGITVVAATVVDFTADRQSVVAGGTVTFQDTSTAGGTVYAWTFGAGEGAGTGTTASHTYNSPGNYTVTHTVTYATGPLTLSRTAYITVVAGSCTVPSFNGIKRNNAQALWFARGFTGLVSDGVGAPSGNYIITAQSIVANSPVPCSSSIQVNRP